MLSDNIFENEKESFIEKTVNRLAIIYRNKIDRYIIFPKQRWALTALLLLLYAWRISIIGGFYVVSYVLGLYILHQAVQFYTPLGLPDSEDDEDDDDSETRIIGDLPTFISENKEE
jgi:hypothetical protein